MKPKKLYTLDKLSQYLGGSKDEIIEMIQFFLETTPLDINQLPELAEKHEWQKIYKIAHKIKPSFDVFAMDDILVDIKNIEIFARENNKEGNLASCIQKLLKKYSVVELLLQDELKK